ncbi:hypothetical protein HK100_000352 [Physocladia obscura]|uniref:Dolichyl-phosphate-mannose--protein mannosyltransferase n=1 Tax=Physocladia obscura TaxID=109957 RepID=A0AAD5SYE4_9FUNG|nr:hypothetical protein HK100_000352 [Physocladia obscura]
MTAELKKRTGKGNKNNDNAYGNEKDKNHDKIPLSATSNGIEEPKVTVDSEMKKDANINSNSKNSGKDYLDTLVQEAHAREAQWSGLWLVGLAFVVVFSLVTRMYRIQDPAKVVFDEVHFGKFASYYLRGEYYFDVHPPLGKLLLAAVAAAAGYDGHYLFDEIGDDYAAHGVPFVAMRLFPALCGALIPPFCFLSLKELGLSFSAAFWGALILIFGWSLFFSPLLYLLPCKNFRSDNALITQSRLILLDSMLLLFGVTSIYAWIRFYKERQFPFSFSWWLWLSLTGVSLALTLGVKMVGLFTIAVVGIAVLFDLWRILDIEHGLSMTQFYEHFAARAICLIVLPISLYLSFFYIHFALLPYTGPGDAFMSPRFQSTLSGNEIMAKSVSVPYTSQITLKNKNQGVFLHSHDAKYPLTYENGHVSSEGQQVTGYHHPDGNNVWEIFAVDPSLYSAAPEYIPTAAEKERSLRYVKNGDIVRLRHVGTQKYLLTHDVASPLTSTNMEITAVEGDERYAETLWKISTTDGNVGDKVYSMRSHFTFVSVPYGVALHPNVILPEWGFAQIEINGEKKLESKGNVWYFDEIIHDTIVDGVDKYEPQKIQSGRKAAGTMPFILKFLELQNVMFVQNAGLTTSHPYSSSPNEWPFVVRGISFWETKEGLRQIYLLGNPFIWWFCIASVGVYAGIWLVDRIVLRRQVDLLGPSLRRWFDNAIGFLFLAWLLHYIPFFLMGRMLFLHHYLPSFIFSTMLAAALMDFVFRLSSECGPETLIEDKVVALRVPVFVWANKSGPFGSVLFVGVLGAILSVFLWSFAYFAPLSYGSGFPVVEDIRERKWFKAWDFQHA